MIGDLNKNQTVCDSLLNSKYKKSSVLYLLHYSQKPSQEPKFTFYKTIFWPHFLLWKMKYLTLNIKKCTEELKSMKKSCQVI